MAIPVSVIMPVYNRQDYLSEAIESILDQSFHDFEFIIIDDCSTDDSLAIALEYQKRDTRIRIHRHLKNTGIVGGRNTGLQLAAGKYIAWMDSDDVSLPDRLEKQFLFLESHPEVGITSSNAIEIDEKGNFLSIIRMPQSNILIRWAFCFYDPIINPAVMANRELCIAVGGYRDLAKDRTEYFPEDYDLWVRLHKSTKFFNFSENLLKLRKHGKNITLIRLQSTLRNSAQICHTYVQSILKTELPRTPVEMIWDIANSPSLRDMAKLIEMLYNYFTYHPEISMEERKIIQEDASLRLMRMVRKYPRDYSIVSTFMQAVKINPLLPGYLLKRFLDVSATNQGKR